MKEENKKSGIESKEKKFDRCDIELIENKQREPVKGARPMGGGLSE